MPIEVGVCLRGVIWEGRVGIELRTRMAGGPQYNQWPPAPSPPMPLSLPLPQADGVHDEVLVIPYSTTSLAMSSLGDGVGTVPENDFEGAIFMCFYVKR